MVFLGTKKFHESGGWTDWLGQIGDLFKGRESFDIFCCKTCGKVEFYMEGIGEAMRKESKNE